MHSLLISIKNMVSILASMTLQSKLKPVLYHEEHGTDKITSRPVILPSSLRVVVYILLVTFDEYFSAESLSWD